jgi:hypothetical protein
VPSRRVLFGLWYLAIALGFALLALSYAIRGAALWQVVLRVVVSVGFALLAIAQLRRPAR